MIYIGSGEDVCLGMLNVCNLFRQEEQLPGHGQQTKHKNHVATGGGVAPGHLRPGRPQPTSITTRAVIQESIGTEFHE